MTHLHISEYHLATKGGSVTYAYNLDTAFRELVKLDNYLFLYPRSSSVKSRLAFYLQFFLIILKSWLYPLDSVLSHHPPSAFLSLFLRSSKKLYFCHGPWSSESSSHFGSPNLSLLKNTIQLICLVSSTRVLYISDYMSSLVSIHYHFRNFLFWVLSLHLHDRHQRFYQRRFQSLSPDEISFLCVDDSRLGWA
jgi:hypothetical protein